MDSEKFKEIKDKTRKLCERQEPIYNPYLQTKVVFNSESFHHLCYSDGREREKNSQTLKFRLYPLAIAIIKKSGTVQEYRKMLVKVGKRSKRDGFTKMKEVEFWGFSAIVGERELISIRVILRRIGDGHIIFWSIMPDTKLKGGQKLYRRSMGNG